MGLFKKIKKAVKNPVKAVKSVAATAIKNPVRATMAVGSLGLSEVARAAPIVGDPFKKVQEIGSTGYVAAANAFTGGAYGQASQLGLAVVQPPREDDMGFNIGQFLTGASAILGGGSNPYASQLGGAAQIASAFFPQPTARPAVMQSPSYQMPATMVSNSPVAIRAQAMTAEIFNAGLALLSRLGLPAPASHGAFSRNLKSALGSIASLARRTPSGTMVSLLVGLGIAVYEANLLTVWFAQRRRGRRMNVSNSKALRRAARRIKGFHRLCSHADIIKTRSRSRSFSKCGTCRKSPCRC